MSGDRYWGTNLNDTSDAVTGQGFAYAYDNIGNRTASSRDNEEVSYTANSLNAYSQRTVSDLIDVIGSAETNSTVTVNFEPANRHAKYWHKGLSVTNDSSAVYQEVNVIGVYNPPGSNDPDVVTTATGRVFVAKTPEVFAYDDDGNLLSDGRFSYTWDCEQRLISAETLTNLPASVPRVKLGFTYDYMGRKVKKAIFKDYSGGNYTTTNVISFCYNGWSPVREIDQGYTNYMTWGLDISGTMSGAGGVGGLLAVQKGTNAYCVTYDGNGNVSEYVDTNGVVVAHREYDPFGNTIVATGPMVNDFNFWFSTKYLDHETGLYYYGYRWYSPSLGRFLSRDPIGEEAFILLNRAMILAMRMNQLKSLNTDWNPLNLSQAFHNDPVSRIDVNGMIDHGAWHSNITDGGPDEQDVIDVWYTASQEEAKCCKKAKVRRSATWIHLPDGSGSEGLLPGDFHIYDQPGDTRVGNYPYPFPYELRFNYNLRCTEGANKGKDLSSDTRTFRINGRDITEVQ